VTEQQNPIAQAATTEPKVPKAARLSAKMRAVLEHMAETGDDLKTTANLKGMNIQAAQRAFRKPHVKKAFVLMCSEVRDNAAQSAYLRINNMAQTAESERLKFDASKWVAGVDGISPVQKSDNRHQHNVTFGGFTYPDLEAKDVTPANTKSPTQDD
jgi:myo-inositol catabolism protein IolC